MAKNNPPNPVRHSTQHPSKSSFPNDPLRSSTAFDFGLFTKSDMRDRDNLNELFSKNMQANPTMSLYNSANPDFFYGANANPGLSVDSGLLYNLASHSQQTSSNPTNSEHPSMHPSHKNSMFPPQMTHPGFSEEFLKAGYPPEYMNFYQFGFGDPSMFGPMMSENMGFLDNPFYYPGMNPELAQGEAGNPYQNPFFNNFYGGDLGLPNFFMPNFQNIPLEEYYNLPMQGRLPHSMPGNIENFRGIPGANPQGTQKGKQTQKEKTASNSMSNQNIPNGVSGEMSSQQYLQYQQQYYQQKQQYLQQQNMLNAPKHQDLIQTGQSQKESNVPNSSKASSQALNTKAETKKAVGNNPPIKSPIQSQKEPVPAKKAPSNAPMNVEKPNNNNQNIKTKEEKTLKDLNYKPEDFGSTFDPLKAGFDPTNLTTHFGEFEKYLGKGMLDPMTFVRDMKNTLGSLGLTDEPYGLDVFNKMKEKSRYERQLKIERYKAKKRNWKKNISYECRRRVANTRLRIKGRFISKKDSEKICEFVGKQDEAFNDKKNLKLEFIKNKLNVGDANEDIQEGLAAKPNMAKKFLMNKIDETLTHKKSPVTSKNFMTFQTESEKVRGLLSGSKKIFKVKKRDEDQLSRYDLNSTPTSAGVNKNSFEDKFHQMENKEQEKKGYGFEYNTSGFHNAGFEEMPYEQNDPFGRLNPAHFEKILTEDSRFANIPKEMLEAMFYNMNNMNGMMTTNFMGHLGNPSMNIDPRNKVNYNEEKM